MFLDKSPKYTRQSIKNDLKFLYENIYMLTERENLLTKSQNITKEYVLNDIANKKKKLIDYIFEKNYFIILCPTTLNELYNEIEMKSDGKQTPTQILNKWFINTNI